MKIFSQLFVSRICFFALTLGSHTAITLASEEGVNSSCQDFLTSNSIQLNDLEQLYIDWRKIVGSRLNQALINKNLSTGIRYTQAQLSKDISVDASSIPKYIKGLHSLPLAFANRISQILNVELNWLLAQDLLIEFHLNGFKVLPEHFPGKNRMQALYDAFMATVWSDPKFVKQTSDLNSDINPKLFCIGDCTTEQLVQELKRRGWNVNLNLLN